MIYTVTSTLTAKAAVEGLITQAGQAGNSREASPPAAFVSGRGSGIRASATAGRAERRASAATGGAARVCGAKGVWGHHCDSSIVWGAGLERPYLRLNAKPPGFCDRRQPGLVPSLGRRDREPRSAWHSSPPAKDGVATRIPRAACRPAGASRLSHNGPIAHPVPASLAPPRRPHERRHRAPSPPAECQCHTTL